jgi:hypothetical protein
MGAWLVIIVGCSVSDRAALRADDEPSAVGWLGWPADAAGWPDRSSDAVSLILLLLPKGPKTCTVTAVKRPAHESVRPPGGESRQNLWTNAQ